MSELQKPREVDMVPDALRYAPKSSPISSYRDEMWHAQNVFRVIELSGARKSAIIPSAEPTRTTAGTAARWSSSTSSQRWRAPEVHFRRSIVCVYTHGTCAGKRRSPRSSRIFIFSMLCIFI